MREYDHARLLADLDVIDARTKGLPAQLTCFYDDDIGMWMLREPYEGEWLPILAESWEEKYLRFLVAARDDVPNLTWLVRHYAKRALDAETKLAEAK